LADPKEDDLLRQIEPRSDDPLRLVPARYAPRQADLGSRFREPARLCAFAINGGKPRVGALRAAPVD
jgi:hypothetical protein